jgi:hypothetical protein
MVADLRIYQNKNAPKAYLNNFSRNGAVVQLLILTRDYFNGVFGFTFQKPAHALSRQQCDWLVFTSCWRHQGHAHIL